MFNGTMDRVKIENLRIAGNNFSPVINKNSFLDLTAAVSGAISSGSESESSADVENSKPYAGYRRTNSFDRFPFMSRPLRSAHRPCSTVPSGKKDVLVSGAFVKE